MKKGHILEDPINKIIQRLIVEAGLIDKIKRHYINAFLEADTPDDTDDDDEDDNDQPGVTALTPYHLEGAFAILALGEACGLLSFIIEVAYYHTKKSYKKKTK